MNGEQRRIRDAAELKRLWFTDEARGLIHDHQTETKVVVMDNGTEYECPFVELEADQ